MTASSALPCTDYSADALFAKQSGLRRQLKNPDFSGSWNWGAFFFSWLWLMNHGKVRLGLVFLILDLIPFAGIVAHVYCGMHGNDLAYDARTFSSRSEFSQVQDAWRNWGFACLAFVPWIVFGPVALRELRADHRHIAFGFGPRPSSSHARPATATLAIEHVVTLPPSHRHARNMADPAPQHSMVATAATVVASPAVLAAPARVPASTPTSAVYTVASSPSPMPITPIDRVAREAHPCESALDAVNTALMAMPGEDKYTASVSALHYAGKCGKKAIAVRMRSLALAQKAIAEHDRHSGDWRRDIRESIDVSSGCEQRTKDTVGRGAADCQSMVAQEVQLALMWQIDDRR